MDVSVIIVNYNVRFFLEQCILSVKAASKNFKIEIIVVDNNSSDDSCKIIKENFPEVVLIQNKDNVGFAKANNIGVQQAQGKYILVLNPDTVVSEDVFDKILPFVNLHADLGILGVKLIDGSGRFLPESKRGIPTPKISFGKLFGKSNRSAKKYYAAHILENEISEVEILVGAFMFLKRTVYLDVGGFDETYFMYGEDIDLSYKVLRRGYKNYYYPNTQVIHYKGESTVKNYENLNHFYKAMKIFYKKYFKRNYLYNFIMSAGMQCWFLLKYLSMKNGVDVIESTSKVLCFGGNQQLLNSLGGKYELINEDIVTGFEEVKQLLKSKNVDALIFDNSTISFKKITSYFEELKNEDVLLKIHPHNTNFIIGSSSSINKGQVEILEF